jgi:F0F1-type ATP synthase assembly protein I
LKSNKDVIILEKKKTDNSYLKYSGMAFQQLGAIILGTWIGKMLDNYFANSTPYCTGLFALLGIGAGLYLVLKDVITPKK